METIFFYSPGACSLAGQIVLEWVGQPYHLCRADGAARSTPAYGRINILRQVPALRIDGRLIVENGAILPHLAERSAGLLPPSGTAARDATNQWISYLGTTLHGAFKPLLRPARFSPYEAMYPVLQEASRQAVRSCCAHINHALQQSGFLVGLKAGVADAYLYAISRWGRKFIDMPREFPLLHHHQVIMEQDEAVAFSLRLENDGPATSSHGAYQGHVDLQKL